MTAARAVGRWFTGRGGVIAILALALAALVLAGVSLAPRGSAAPLPCTNRRLLVSFVGDSYVKGVREDGGYQTRFPNLIGKALGADILINASNGSGYVARGPATDALTYPEQAERIDQQSDVVLIVGSRNDKGYSAAKTYKAAVATFRAVQERARKAKIIVIGPIWVNYLPTPGMLRARDSVRSAAMDTGVHFIDPIALGWFGERDQVSGGYHKGILPDGIHPNPAGERYLAEHILFYLRPMVCTR